MLANLQNGVHVVGIDDRGHAVLVGDVLDEGVDDQRGFWIQPAVGLVAEQILGIQHDGARNGHAFLHAAGKLRGVLVRCVFNSNALQTKPHPLFFLVLAKNIAHWLVSGLPVVIASPLLAYMLKLPSESYVTLMLTLLVGTPTLSLIGSIAVALTVGLGSRGLILAVITLPFSVPVLIFGTLAVQASASGLPTGGYLTLLLAILAASLSLAPLTSAAALRISVS